MSLFKDPQEWTDIERLTAQVAQQGRRVQELQRQHHEITERLGTERRSQYRLEQELKGKTSGH